MPRVEDFTNALVSQMNRKHGPCLRCGHLKMEHGTIKFMELQGEKPDLPEKLKACYEKRSEMFGSFESESDGFVPDPNYEMPEDIKALEEILREPQFNLQL